MIELYILIGFAVIVLGLFAWGKVNAHVAKAERVKAQAATASAESAVAAVAQVEKTQTERVAAKQIEQLAQKIQQAAIDTGDRSQFDKDTF
jgi:hypothetical protein